MVGALLLGASSVTYALGLGLAPTRMELVVTPGTHLQKLVRVANFDEQKRIALTVSLADWSLDENGKVVISPPGSTPQSAAEWINFSPAALLVKPKEGQQVVLDIRIPARIDFEPGHRDYRAAVLVDTVLPPAEERANMPSGVWHKYRVSSLLYFSFPALSIEPEIRALRYAPDEEGNPALELSLFNGGNVHARLQGELSLLDENGTKIHRQNLENIVVLDGRYQTKHIGLSLTEPLPGGRYSAEVSLVGVDPEKRRVAVSVSDGFEPLTFEVR